MTGVGFLLIGLGAILLYSGFVGEDPREVIAASLGSGKRSGALRLSAGSSPAALGTAPDAGAARRRTTVV